MLQLKNMANAVAYFDGDQYLGPVAEVDLPDLKFKMSGFQPLGVLGEMEFPSGLDKLEATVKWTGPNQKVYKLSANAFKSVQVQIRGNVETWDSTGRSAQEPFVMFLTGRFKSTGMGKFKQHDPLDYSSMMTITAARLEIAGENLFEVDVTANIYTVEGVDMMAAYKANTGAV